MAPRHRVRETIVTVRAGGWGAVALLVLALGVGACGEDEPEGPSKEEYVRQVNETCAANAAEIEDITDLNLQGRKLDTFEARSFAEQLAPALDAFVLQIDQLEKPAEDVADVERLISIYKGTAEDAERAGTSSRRSVAFVASLNQRVKLIDEAAEAAGAPNCGSKG
jgi:hypothetical protein